MFKIGPGLSERIKSVKKVIEALEITQQLSITHLKTIQYISLVWYIMKWRFLNNSDFISTTLYTSKIILIFIRHWNVWLCLRKVFVKICAQIEIIFCVTLISFIFNVCNFRRFVLSALFTVFLWIKIL